MAPPQSRKPKAPLGTRQPLRHPGARAEPPPGPVATVRWASAHLRDRLACLARHARGLRVGLLSTPPSALLRGCSLSLSGLPPASPEAAASLPAPHVPRS